ncbi:MAG: ferric reductase-like transmembrane domain-containing protein [Polyangiaceae bacterium]|nr:ferric reductase-like transmembrane domain-containing protein [Polyangiaceae bacterium]
MSKRILQGAGVGIALLVLLGTIGARAGLLTTGIERPEGHAFWYLSRASGITAYLGVTLEVLLGLLLSTAAGDRWLGRAQGVEIHRWLSSVSLSLVAAHGAALVFDRFVRFDLLDVLVPFLSPYRPFAVGLGVVAGYLGAAVHLSFGLRKRLGPRAWRLLHVASFPMFWLATAHGLLAGTDSPSLAMRATYSLSAGLVLWLTFYRILGSAAQPVGRARRA